MSDNLQCTREGELSSTGAAAAVAKSTALMSAATLISRLTGLARTWAMAFALGNTYVTSAYQVANNMPNVVFDLVAGGVLVSAFLPVFMSERERAGKAGSDAFASNMLNITVLLLGLLAVLSSVFAPQLIATQTFTVGEEAEVVSLSVELLRIFAFQLVFYGISGIVTAMLNASRSFFLPALAPALNNLCVIASFIAYIPLSEADPHAAVAVLGIGATLGVAVQALVQIPALVRSGFKWRPVLSLREPSLVEAMRIAVPTVVYILGTLVAFSCRNAFSLDVGDNGPATLLYAWTWYQLPYGVVAVSLSRALFTELGEARAKGDGRRFRSLVEEGISNTLFLIVPLAALMFALAVPLMELFQAGSFGGDDVSYVAGVLGAWMFSLPFYAVLMFLNNVLAAMKRLWPFALVSTVMVAVQCLLYWVLCRPGGLGLLGVPIADLVYYAACSAVLLAWLRREEGGLGGRHVVVMSAKVVAASVIAAVIAYGIAGALPVGEGMLAGLVKLAVAGCAGLGVVFGLCKLMRVDEVESVLGLVRGIAGRFGRG